MVVVGLDAARAVAELARLAPPDEAPAQAAARARDLVLPPAGAAEAIATALDQEPATGEGRHVRLQRPVGGRPGAPRGGDAGRRRPSRHARRSLPPESPVAQDRARRDGFEVLRVRLPRYRRWWRWVRAPWRLGSGASAG